MAPVSCFPVGAGPAQAHTTAQKKSGILCLLKQERSSARKSLKDAKAPRWLPGESVGGRMQSGAPGARPGTGFSSSGPHFSEVSSSVTQRLKVPGDTCSIWEAERALSLPAWYMA